MIFYLAEKLENQPHDIVIGKKLSLLWFEIELSNWTTTGQSHQNEYHQQSSQDADGIS